MEKLVRLVVHKFLFYTEQFILFSMNTEIFNVKPKFSF